MEDVLLEFLLRLDAINEHHGGLDEAASEVMGDAVFDGFIKPHPDFVLRDEFGMNSSEADELVKATLEWFIPAAAQACQQEGLTTFHERLAAFQNLNVQTEATTCYNDFFDWWNPEQFDEFGNVKGR
jgi:hypothetical protein